MKIFTLIYIGILGWSLLFFACEPLVVFEDAMPPEVEAINHIPPSFQGVYLCESDSTLMYVNENLVYQETYFKFITTLDKVEQSEDCVVLDSTLFFPWKESCVPFEFLSDSIIEAKIFEVDTLFRFAENEVAKLYKGRLFMNIKDGQNHWSTFMVSPMVDGSLQWEYIEIPPKLKDIETISPNYRTRALDEDKTQFILRPTLVEFENIVSKGYLRECDILKPLPIDPIYIIRS